MWPGVCHQRGLVHRDIKPSNLMLTRDGTVKILDLGLAKLQDKINEHEQLTAAGSPVGTMDYIAPEQVENPSRVDIRADLYSLGCTLFELLTGRPPYMAPQYATYSAKIMAHLGAPFPSVRQLRPEVPDGLEGVLQRLVAKDPAERFGRSGELVQAIGPYCKEASPPETTMIPDAPKLSREERLQSSRQFSSEARIRMPGCSVAFQVCIAITLLVTVTSFSVHTWSNLVRGQFRELRGSVDTRPETALTLTGLVAVVAGLAIISVIVALCIILWRNRTRRYEWERRESSWTNRRNAAGKRAPPP